MRPATLSLLLLAITACTGRASDASTVGERGETAAAPATPPASPATPRDLGADSALAAIRAFGARRVLDSLYNRDHAAYARYDRGIASGDSLWLEVAREIRPATDGETGESLVDVLSSEALLRAPRLVLRLAADTAAGFGTQICTPSFYEDTADSVVAAVTARARAALLSVDEPELRATRDACLAATRAHPSP